VGEGKTGRVNVIEPLLMPREAEPRMVDDVAGFRDCRWEAAGAGRGGDPAG
jgi:hypothetical protein